MGPLKETTQRLALNRRNKLATILLRARFWALTTSFDVSYSYASIWTHSKAHVCGASDLTLLFPTENAERSQQENDQLAYEKMPWNGSAICEGQKQALAFAGKRTYNY